jgi:6-phosphogluconolactonase (cycloisomerase 2 family)
MTVPPGRRKIWIAVSVCALGLVSVPGASAATNLTQKPGTAGCVTETGTSGECQVGRGLVGAAAIALSPDGASAYVASSSWNSIAVLTRNPVDGTLTPIQNPAGCFYSNSSTFMSVYNICTKVRELAGAADVAVSPDGKNVYVASPSDSAVAIFSRIPTSGELALSSGSDGCVNADGSNSCVAGRALGGATSVTVSPDGASAYVASSGPDGGIAIFDRDPTTGDLTQKSGALGCINETGADGCMTGPNQILGALDVTLSPDGKTLYVVSSTRNAVTIYSRDTTSGDLTPLAAPGGCLTRDGGSGCETGVAMIAPVSITVGPDGDTAYVAGERSDSIAIFDRDPATGELTQKAGTAGCISNTGFSDPMQTGTLGACQDDTAMDGIDSVAILPDGSALYATAQNSSGVDVFERAPDGTLTQRPGTAGCITETGYENTSLPWTAGICGDGSALQSANEVIASADGKHAYTVALDGGVGIFDVVQPPSMQRSPPTPPPPPATDNGNALQCELARTDLSQAQHHIKLAQSAIDWQKRALANADSSRAKHKLRRAIRKNRGKIKLWSGREASAEQGVMGLCG